MLKSNCKKKWQENKKECCINFGAGAVSLVAAVALDYLLENYTPMSWWLRALISSGVAVVIPSFIGCYSDCHNEDVTAGKSFIRFLAPVAFGILAGVGTEAVIEAVGKKSLDPLTVVISSTARSLVRFGVFCGSTCAIKKATVKDVKMDEISPFDNEVLLTHNNEEHSFKIINN